MRKLATSLVLLGLAVVLMAAEVAASAPAIGPGPNVITVGQMTLRLTSTTPGVTFDGNTLVCPPMLITTSSGANLTSCQFTISRTGAVQPGSVAVTMTVSGISAAQVSAEKFAIDPQPGPLVYFGTASQTIYRFAGAQLPATVDPGVLWGANAGTPLDNSDMGAAIVVTYSVVAESVEGETASPTVAPTKTPFEAVGGETATPVQTVTPPPTGSTSDSPSHNSTPLVALLICFLLGGIGLTAAQSRRRSIRR